MILGEDSLPLAKSPLKAPLYPQIFILFYTIKEWSLTIISLIKNSRNSLTALSYLIKMIVKEKIILVWQLILLLFKNYNMFQMKHWPLTLVILLMLMMTSLTYNCCIILIGLLNLSYGMVIFILFLFMVL